MIATPPFVAYTLNNLAVQVPARRVGMHGCVFPWEDNPYGRKPWLVQHDSQVALVWATDERDAQFEAEDVQFVHEDSQPTITRAFINYHDVRAVVRLAEARGADMLTLEGY